MSASSGESTMNINASIVDQRIGGILEDHQDLFGDEKDPDRRKTNAFTTLVMSAFMGMPLEEASELLTDGGNDAGIDGMHIGEEEDGEFSVTLFQTKYRKDLNVEANFPETAIQKAINTIGVLFDPSKDIQLNPRIAPRVEEIRSLIRDGYIPNIRMVFSNNGAIWTKQSQNWMDQSGFPSEQVQWIHYNHDSIIAVLQKKRSVNDSLRMHGKAVLEEFNFRRVLIGKVPVTEIAELFNRHDDLLLERNIRRYLGMHSNRVNSAIHQTLIDPEKRENFFFFNNGITMICRQFRHNALQGENFQVKLDGLQIINGGQTCKTIQQTLNSPDLLSAFESVYVLVRIYELADNDQGFVHDITYATNSQNPVDLRDLRSNDEIQKQLELGIKELGYSYKRQREETSGGPTVVTSSVVAESVLAIWRRSPHQAKFRRREHFGALYKRIFENLNAAQALMAVQIFRYVENQRKRPMMENPPEFLPYAAHYMAMLMGNFLLQTVENNGMGTQITHRNFKEVLVLFEREKESFLVTSIQDISVALKGLYGEDRKLSLQQLSATFRRGDLMEFFARGFLDDIPEVTDHVE